MDIPNTGAIFTLGRSHLAENTQSYFYIKNDPIKKLIAGPHQSAVICESGRLFIWGENHFGQLGIAGSSSLNTNSGSKNYGDIIIKPTCVKSFKSLGLRISDIAFGNEWSVVLSYSNELFFSGRCVFATESTVSTNFKEETIGNETYRIIPKPFRLDAFDNYLSNNEAAENFENVLAGNEHFVVLTSFGRLVGWGSNQYHQLGSPEASLRAPHEIILNSPVQQFTCGPESTLVLTQKGGLYLTGRLNEFVFPQFTELQKNLSPNEQIIFMHISHASEIFIVTNTGSIYRSLESKRNKSLIFQRFYDYDSEENGPIWKILKGMSFYAVLTKANKFYTTFSESGHHLKTFREISKFKNLRLLDMALGDQHVLVHGIPRSSTFAATSGPGGGQRIMSPGKMSNTTGQLITRIGSLNKRGAESEENQILEYPSAKTGALPQNQDKSSVSPIAETFFNTHEHNGTNAQENTDSNNNRNQMVTQTVKDSSEIYTTNSVTTNNPVNVDGKKSPTESLKSRYSLNSISNLRHVSSSEKTLRPRTPYPESSGGSSPQTVVRKSPLQNTSFEKAMKEVSIEKATPEKLVRLDDLPDSAAGSNVSMPRVKVCMPSPPTEEDEELTLEIRETTDPFNNTVTINEIRFINNGIDVTANVKKLKSLASDDSLDKFDDEAENVKNSSIQKQAEEFLDELEEELDVKVENIKSRKADAEASHLENNVGSKIEVGNHTMEIATKKRIVAVGLSVLDAEKSMEAAGNKVVVEAREAVGGLGVNDKKTVEGAKATLDNVSSTVVKVTGDALKSTEQIGTHAASASEETKDAIGNTIRKMAEDTRQAMGSVSSKISHEVQDAKNSLSFLMHGKKNKVDVGAPTKLTEVKENIQEVIFVKETSGYNRPTPNTPSCQQEDDERTTASVNSNHTSAGNPFESNDSNNLFDSSNPFDEELNQMIERSKLAYQEDVERLSQAADQHIGLVEDSVLEKSKFSKFLDDVREKSKALSCRHEKSVKIVDDQPPRYTEEDEFALQPINGHHNGSKICIIL